MKKILLINGIVASVEDSEHIKVKKPTAKVGLKKSFSTISKKSTGKNLYFGGK